MEKSIPQKRRKNGCLPFGLYYGLNNRVETLLRNDTKHSNWKIYMQLIFCICLNTNSLFYMALNQVRFSIQLILHSSSEIHGVFLLLLFDNFILLLDIVIIQITWPYNSLSRLRYLIIEYVLTIIPRLQI